MLDLHSFWGQEKIQEALGTFHRNTDKHERIARWMVSRRHKYSVVECYTKIVFLQQDYKRVVAYSNQSGNPSAAYPFYKELHCILREEASIKPKTMPRSLNLQVVKEGWVEDLFEGKTVFSEELIGLRGVN
uniref:Uncharacterized protein n=1 Tax=Sphaerodactylus townsendi TaxID=933632 RepID=A0ACB8GBB8_9SAUR